MSDDESPPRLVIALPLQQKDFRVRKTRNFTCFSRLPTEIRLKIWSIAVPRGRILRFEIEPHLGQYRIYGRFSRVPSIMHICHESREVGLGQFRRGFPHLQSQNGEVYWSPEADTLFYVPHRSKTWNEVCSVLYLGIHTMLPIVRHLALPLTDRVQRSFGDGWLKGLAESLQKPHDQTTLTFVLDPHLILRRPYPSAVAFHEPLDVAVDRLDAKKPSEVETHVKSVLESSKFSQGPKSLLPTATCLVLAPRKFKRSGFCAVLEREGYPDPEEITNEDARFDLFWPN